MEVYSSVIKGLTETELTRFLIKRPRNLCIIDDASTSTEDIELKTPNWFKRKILEWFLFLLQIKEEKLNLNQ